MSDRYFPIESKSACKLKWAWNSLDLHSGNTMSCCKVPGVVIDVDNFDSFHNNPSNVKSRQMMLNGDRPAECNYCWKVEDHDGLSYRQYHNKIPNIYPRELDNNSSEVNVVPTLLEVFFTNTCNLKCLYCSDASSSQIQEENRQYGKFISEGVVIENIRNLNAPTKELTEKFWIWLDKNYDSLERLHILGGEPFFQKELSQLISFMEKRENRKLEFEIVSNLAVDTQRIEKSILLIKNLIKQKKIARFEIFASIDCWGEEQEYVRSGLDLNLWKKNFEFLVNERWIILGINQVISTLTLRSMPSLIKYINKLRNTHKRKIGHQAGTVYGTHSFLDAKILGKKCLSEMIEDIDKELNSDDWQTKEVKLLFSGFFSSIITKHPEKTELKKLSIFLDEIDRRRGKNWKKIFPWLTNIMEENNVV